MRAKSVVLGTLAVCLWVIIWIYSSVPDEFTHLIFCDVGQGDAILVTTGSVQMLVDGGPDHKVLSCLKQHLPFWDRTIELVVATHADKDHVGGLQPVLERYNVAQIMIQESTKNTADFRAFKALISRKVREGMTIIQPKRGHSMILADEVKATIIFTREGVANNSPRDTRSTETLLSADNRQKGEQKRMELSENDGSIVLLLQVGEVATLLTGDIESNAEQALITHQLIPDVDILKVAHHGSKTSSTDVFLRLVQPEISVVSAGKNNAYGHPSSQVLDRLSSSGSQIWRTDREGTIELISDGIHYWRKEDQNVMSQAQRAVTTSLKSMVFRDYGF